jgi:hypothetical protein
MDNAIVKKQDERKWIGLIWLRLGQGADLGEHGTEPLGFIKCG